MRLGKTEAFSELVRSYQQKVRGYCFHMLSDWEMAEDASQDIFVKAFQSLDRFGADSSFSTWLFRITVNHCIDVTRKNRRRKSESLDALTEEKGEGLAALIDSGADPMSSAEHRDLVAKLFSRLRAEEREILVLREVQEFSYTEIAEVLDCSLDSVKGRLKRARNKLLEVSRHICAPTNVKTLKEEK